MSLFSDDELPAPALELAPVLPVAAPTEAVAAAQNPAPSRAPGGAPSASPNSGASLALARKYRPRVFGELIGQDHVVRALTQALTTQRLHHAYLFTGTRGVGKTTISRIFAKALNCDTGITAVPCGVCQSCREIDSGRFVDYVEMDAASNRSVDEMTQVLEQAVYKPTAGRFKVYMIDEVHMLTNHAFNAMLKTLEEPPEYVKFVLATTDPQKVPVTVLSRCLQFNLKQMPRPEIAQHLQHILAQEAISSEPAALQLIARAAAGSMRDALSLTDQAIAYSGANVAEDTVREMLGTVDQTYLLRLLDALGQGDGAALLATADEMQARSVNLALALDDLAALLQRLAVQQVVPQSADALDPEAFEMTRLAQLLAPEDIQLYYSLALKGRQELPLAPDEAVGFTMTLLRMLSFGVATPGGRGSVVTSPAPAKPAARSAAPAASSSSVPLAIAPPRATVLAAVMPVMPAFPVITKPIEAIKTVAEKPYLEVTTAEIIVPKLQTLVKATAPAQTQVFPQAVAQIPSAPAIRFTGDWIAFCVELAASGLLGGLPRELALQSELIEHAQTADGWALKLRTPKATLLSANAADKLKVIIESALNCTVSLATELGDVANSAALETQRARAERQRLAEETAANDSLSSSLLRDFGGKIVPESIRANDA